MHVVLLFTCQPALGGHVPDTGQTACYDNTAEIACPAPGEPFYGQDAQYDTGSREYIKLDGSGLPLPDTAESWAMVRDTVTGLTWEVKTDDGSIHDFENSYSWNDARDIFIPALNQAAFGGCSDWRLPEIHELSYLIDRGTIDPAVDTDYFPLVALYYWTATPDPSAALGPYYVQFFTGYEYNFIKDGDGAMAVRGDIAQRGMFVDNGDGTVSDQGTGLMWQQAGPAQTMDWQEALAYCENLELAGYSDWRLPNVNELQSLVDYTRYGPSIDTDFFPAAVAASYRTSTSIPGGYTDRAWVVDFDLGYVDFYFGSGKSALHYVRAVRGAGSSTLVELSSLSAERRGFKHVAISWTTASEVDSAGFNIYRCAFQRGRYVRVNEALIPARGSPTGGAAYEFVDESARWWTNWYRLEDIDSSGESMMHDPVRATYK